MIVATLARTPAGVETRDSLPTSASGWRHLAGAMLSFGGYATAAGYPVSDATALQHPTVIGCVRVIADALAQLSRHVHRRLERGSEIARDHPVDPLISRLFNPRQTASQAFTFLIWSLLLRGNAIAWIQRDASGDVAGIYPLRWDYVDLEIEAGQVVYIHRPPRGAERRLRRDQVWHVWRWSLDGVEGISPISAAREAIGYGLSMQDWSSRLFSNGALPSGSLKHPGTLGGTPEERVEAIARLRAQFDALYTGTENARKTIVLEEGMEWAPVSLNAEDSEFLASRKLNRQEIAGGIFGVPLHLIGDQERGEFSIDTIARSFVDYSLTPWVRLLEQTADRDLLLEGERDRHFIRWNVASLLRGQPADRAQLYSSGIMAGWLTRNEVREKEDMNPLDGLDEPLAPLAQGLAAPDGTIIAPRPAAGGTPPRPPAMRALELRARTSADRRAAAAARMRPVFEDLVVRVLQGETDKVRELLRRHLGAEEERAAQDGAKLEALRADLEQLYAPESSFRSGLFVRFLPATEAVAGTLFELAADEVDAETDRADLPEFIAALAAAAAARYALRSLSNLQAALEADPADARAAIEDVFETWKEHRPAVVARRETVQQARASAREAWRRSGVQRLRWVARGSETCPFCRRMDGRIVAIEGPFLGEGEELPGAQGRPPLRSAHSILHPPLHRGCDCEIVPA